MTTDNLKDAAHEAQLNAVRATLAEDVRRATTAFNLAVARASAQGIEVSVSVLMLSQVGLAYDQPQLSVRCRREVS